MSASSWGFVLAIIVIISLAFFDSRMSKAEEAVRKLRRAHAMNRVMIADMAVLVTKMVDGEPIQDEEFLRVADCMKDVDEQAGMED